MKYMADCSIEQERKEKPQRTVRTEKNAFREQDPHRLKMRD